MKARLLPIAGLWLLLNLAFFVAVIMPAWTAIRDQAATAQDLQTRMGSLRREQREHELVNALLTGIEQFRHRIPPQGSILAMTRRLTDQAHRLQLHVPSIKYQPVPVPEEDLVRLAIQLDVEGPYGAIRRFLYELEGLQDPLMIEKLVLTNPRGTERLTLRLQLAAYFLAEGGSPKVGTVAAGRPGQGTDNPGKR
jgi:hypothetical protein